MWAVSSWATHPWSSQPLSSQLQPVKGRLKHFGMRHFSANHWSRLHFGQIAQYPQPLPFVPAHVGSGGAQMRVRVNDDDEIMLIIQGFLACQSLGV
jgi:hypothetical protein